MSSLGAADYVWAAGRDGSAGLSVFVPVPIAAAALEVEATTVRAYLRSGPLEELIVESGTERWRGVELGSLFRELKRRRELIDDLVQELHPILLSRLGTTVEYGELMREVSLTWRDPHHRKMIGKALGQLSRDSLEHPDMKFLISAMVVSKNTQQPNQAFFDLAVELFEMDEEDETGRFWEAQMKKIKRHVKKFGV